MEFQAFNKIPRLSRDCVITEKIDGTNAQIYIPDLPDEFPEDAPFWVGSRNRWITPDKDNFGFARWAYENAQELLKLGPGRHFGEWWGSGIQRRYGLEEKRFSLFNVRRWATDRDEDKFPQPPPECCVIVPVLYRGLFDTGQVESTLYNLKMTGSHAAPGFMNPEGIVIYHEAAGVLFKKTIIGDEAPKSKGG
jgi:hypothetical protein